MKKILLAALAIVLASSFGKAQDGSSESAARYGRELQEGQITTGEYQYLMGGLKDLANMKALSKGKPAPYPESMPKEKKSETFDESAARYAQELKEGKLTESEYDYLMAGLKDLANMKALSKGKPAPYPESMPKPEKKLTSAECARHFAQELKEGKLTQSEYDDLMGGLKDLAEMKAIARG